MAGGAGGLSDWGDCRSPEGTSPTSDEERIQSLCGSKKQQQKKLCYHKLIVMCCKHSLIIQTAFCCLKRGSASVMCMVKGQQVCKVTARTIKDVVELENNITISTKVILRRTISIKSFSIKS